MSCIGNSRKAATVLDKIREDRQLIQMRDIGPNEPCALCAEKHISAAAALANEHGYEAINRQRIIGELTLGADHLWRIDRALAEDARNIRHLVQQRRENDIDWNTILSKIDVLAANEVKNGITRNMRKRITR